MKILNNLGQDEEASTAILNEDTNLQGHGIDLQFLHKKAMDELKGKKPISVPSRTHNDKVEKQKQKVFYDSIKIRKKRARSDEDDDDFDQHHQEKAIPEALKQIMAMEKGIDAVMVIQKKLSQTDVNPLNECLSLPMSELDSSFLSQTQKESLFQHPEEEGKKKKMPRIEAKLLEPNGSVSEIYLTMCNMKGGDFLNLVTNWKDLVNRNRLREGMEVQVWSFRGADSQLWLALFTV